MSFHRKIAAKKACVNVKKNNDVFCFKWALISAFYPTHHSDRCESYNVDIRNIIIKLPNGITLNFSNMDFPLDYEEIHTFDSQNADIGVSLFGYDLDENHIIGPFYYTKGMERKHHIHLLFLQEGDERFHYVWIKNISKLLRDQMSKHHHVMKMCNCCLQRFSSDEKLQNHAANDCLHMYTRMPSGEKESKLTFKNHQKAIDVPFVVYADFESILEDCRGVNVGSHGTNIQHHVPCAFAYQIVCNFDSSLNKMELYVGESSPYVLMERLIRDCKNLYNSYIMKNVPMIPLSPLENQHHYNASVCHICELPFKSSDRVMDHCYLTGEYRGPAHSECNILYRVP